MEKGVWGHRPVLEGGREGGREGRGGGGGGVRSFPFSTENSQIVAYSPPDGSHTKKQKFSLCFFVAGSWRLSPASSQKRYCAHAG